MTTEIAILLFIVQVVSFAGAVAILTNKAIHCNNRVAFYQKLAGQLRRKLKKISGSKLYTPCQKCGGFFKQPDPVNKVEAYCNKHRLFTN